MRDHFNLDQAALRQLRNLYAGPGRFVIAEEIGINPVHRGKIRHVFQKNRRLDDVFLMKSGFFQNRMDILQRLS